MIKNNCLTQNSELVEVQNKLYRVFDVLGDGNCLYRCFAHCIENNENNHAIYRKKVVDYVFENFEKEKERLVTHRIFGSEDSRSKRYKSAEKYKEAMGTFSEFGTDFEAVIFAEIYKVNLTLFRKNQRTKLINKLISNELTSSDKKLNLMLTGHFDGGHWVVLEEINNDEKHLLQTSILKTLRCPSNHDLSQNLDELSDASEPENLEKLVVETEIFIQSEFSEDSSENESESNFLEDSNKKTIKKNETNVKKVKKIIYKYCIAVVEGLLVDILSEKGFQSSDKIRNFIERQMLEKLNCTCERVRL